VKGGYVTLFCGISYLLKYLGYILIYTLDSFPSAVYKRTILQSK